MPPRPLCSEAGSHPLLSDQKSLAKSYRDADGEPTNILRNSPLSEDERWIKMWAERGIEAERGSWRHMSAGG